MKAFFKKDSSELVGLAVISGTGLIAVYSVLLLVSALHFLHS